MIPLVDTRRQYDGIRPEIDRAIAWVIAKGNFILGPEVEKFEREFADYCGVKHAIGVGSGTEALTIALKAVGIGTDDEVITVPNTYKATVEAICNVGAFPLFVDVDPNTHTMDASKLNGKKHLRVAKAVIPVHLYGHPADIGQIRLATELKLPIIADCCQAHGAMYKGFPVASFADITAYSFYPSKNLGAFGDGGALVTDNDVLATNARWLRNHGEGHVVGYNSRLDELQAAVLRVKLRHLTVWNNTRRDIAETYDRLLGDLVNTPMEHPDARHVYHLYVIEVCNKDRNNLVEYLNSHGIEARIHYPVPVHLQEPFKFLKYSAGDFPTAERLARRVVSLPMFPELTSDEIKQVADQVKAFLREQSKMEMKSDG